MSRNFHKFTFYWHWRIGRFGFMIWTFGWRRRGFPIRFSRRSDGGWVFCPLGDISLVWEGKDEQRQSCRP
jgi:hypothetical protein